MTLGSRLLLMAASIGLGFSSLTAGPALAADKYPERPVTVIVGYAAGGATDMLARLISQSLSEELGQPVIVENRAGANSNIATDYVARAKNDGYTVYLSIIGNTINRALYKDLRHDFLEDFEYVGLVASIANVLVVHPDRPYANVQEYIDYAKANPGDVTCASSGTGSSIHMSCELFKMHTGTDILHVPYRGGGPAVTDLLSGQVDSMFDNMPSAVGHVNAGALRALATTTSERVPNLADVPTFAEEGMEDFVVEGWFGLNVPAGTPESIVQRLNGALNSVLQKPDIIEVYKKNNYLVPEAPNSPETFRNYAVSEIERWGAVVEHAGISVE